MTQSLAYLSSFLYDLSVRHRETASEPLGTKSANALWTQSAAYPELASLRTLSVYFTIPDSRELHYNDFEPSHPSTAMKRPLITCHDPGLLVVLRWVRSRLLHIESTATCD